jgi:hypothetical protein
LYKNGHGYFYSFWNKVRACTAHTHPTQHTAGPRERERSRPSRAYLPAGGLAYTLVAVLGFWVENARNAPSECEYSNG